VIKLRLYILFSAFSLVAAILVFRAFQLQMVPSVNVENLARRQLRTTIEIVGARGNIYDRRGRELAVSVNTSSIYVNPHLIREPDRVAKALSQVLGVSLSHAKERLNKARGRRFVWIERQLSYVQQQKLRTGLLEGLAGVGILPEYRREYPNASLGAHLLGYVSIDGKGLAALEFSYDERLKGTKKKLEVQRDARGRPIFTHLDQIRLADHRGENLHLTLDASLQSRVERILIHAKEKHEADAALAVVMNPHTGEILSMASVPTYDSNRAGSYPLASRRNRVITDPIEPGSVLKTFVVARALEDGIVGPTTKVSGGGGRIRIGRKVITESDNKHNADWLTVKDLMRVSSNVATVNLQRKMGFDKIADTFTRLGFSQASGLGLSGESRGIFRVPTKRQELEQATMSFGHGIALTPLQVARAYAVLANGGYFVNPVLLRKDTAKDLPKERIFSEKTISQITQMLESVVHEEGTGVRARVEGFRSAGKTGTSLKNDPVAGGYLRGAYWSSFVGYFPAQKPEIVIYVMVDNPRKEGRYASVVAAPLFAEIAKAYIGVGLSSVQMAAASVEQRKNNNLQSLKTKKNLQLVKSEENSLSDNKMPDLAGLSLTQALRILETKNIEVEIHNSGNFIEGHLPLAGASMDQDRRVYLRLR
jgi:cell division protein FtsI (penicillin-binding protein 3)